MSWEPFLELFWSFVTNLIARLSFGHGDTSQLSQLSKDEGCESSLLLRLVGLKVKIVIQAECAEQARRRVYELEQYG